MLGLEKAMPSILAGNLAQFCHGEQCGQDVWLHNINGVLLPHQTILPEIVRSNAGVC